jgi:hypothetical protein
VTYDLAGFYQEQAVLDLDLLDSGVPRGRAEIQQAARRAAERLNRAVAILIKLVSLEPTNHSWLATQAYQQVLLGNLELTRLDTADGARRAARGYAALMSEATLPQANVDVLEMATLAGLRVSQTLRNTQATVACARRLVAGTHRQDPGHLLLLSRALRADGQLAAALATAKEGLALLPQTDASPPSRLGRMLGQEASGS